jgi:hypothetical protein
MRLKPDSELTLTRLRAEFTVTVGHANGGIVSLINKGDGKLIACFYGQDEDQAILRAGQFLEGTKVAPVTQTTPAPGTVVNPPGWKTKGLGVKTGSGKPPEKQTPKTPPVEDQSKAEDVPPTDPEPKPEDQEK